MIKGLLLGYQRYRMIGDSLPKFGLTVHPLGEPKE